jgi:hypothetical protein
VSKKLIIYDSNNIYECGCRGLMEINPVSLPKQIGRDISTVTRIGHIFALWGLV